MWVELHWNNGHFQRPPHQLVAILCHAGHSLGWAEGPGPVHGFRHRNLCRDKNLNGQSDLELGVSDTELGNRLPECHSPSPLAHTSVWKSLSPTSRYCHDLGALSPDWLSHRPHNLLLISPDHLPLWKTVNPNSFEVGEEEERRKLKGLGPRPCTGI